jgi:hypothetical protein
VEYEVTAVIDGKEHEIELTPGVGLRTTKKKKR